MLQGYHWSVKHPVAVMSLVHGLAEHCGRYEELAQHLNRNGIAVVGIDLRGHGLSAGPRGVSRPVSYTHLTLPTIYSV